MRRGGSGWLGGTGVHRKEKLFDALTKLREIIAIVELKEYVSAQICRHLGAGFSNNQYAVLSLDPDKVAGFEDNIVTGCCAIRGRALGQWIIACKEKQTSRASRSGFLYLMEYGPPRSKVSSPVQDTKAKVGG